MDNMMTTKIAKHSVDLFKQSYKPLLIEFKRLLINLIYRMENEQYETFTETEMLLLQILIRMHIFIKKVKKLSNSNNQNQNQTITSENAEKFAEAHYESIEETVEKIFQEHPEEIPNIYREIVNNDGALTSAIAWFTKEKLLNKLAEETQDKLLKHAISKYYQQIEVLHEIN